MRWPRFGIAVAAVAVCSGWGAHALENGVGRTPMMGWMAWLRHRCSVNCDADPENCVSEHLIKSVADAMVANGYRDAGYHYVSLDDCWQAPHRAANGTLRADPARFPSGIKALADYVHSRGLLFGMYTAMGEHTCCDYPGLGCTVPESPIEASCAQARQDVATFVEWGIDYIKVDSCRTAQSKPADTSAFNVTHPLVSSWFLDAGRKAGRPVLYHPSGIILKDRGPKQYRLYGAIANMWRSYKDMQPVFSEVLDIINYWAADDNASHPTAGPNEWQAFLDVSRPGVVQDPDALVVGNTFDAKACRACPPGGTDPSQKCPDRRNMNAPCMCCGTLTLVEEQTNFAMWAMFAAPLEIGGDVRNMRNASAAILKNPEVIAVNQDALVRQARRVSVVGGVQLWRKDLADGTVAVALLNGNNGTFPAAVLRFADVGFTDVDNVTARDLVARADLGAHVGVLALGAIPAHGVRLVRLAAAWQEQPMPAYASQRFSGVRFP